MKKITLLVILLVISHSLIPLIILPVGAADIITNGSFVSDLSDWTPNITDGSLQWYATGYANGGCAEYDTGESSEVNVDAYLEQSIGTINSDDVVELSFAWKKQWAGNNPSDAQLLEIIIVKPDVSTATIWSESTIYEDSGWVTVSDLDVSSDFDQTGSYSIRLRGFIDGGKGGSTSSQAYYDEIVLDVSDITPPASVTGLTNSTYEQTYINWTWTNPSDADFNHTMVYINSVWETNVSSPTAHYNDTELTANTEYEISTHTVDTTGNINSTWVNATAYTKPEIVSVSVTPTEYGFGILALNDQASTGTGGYFTATNDGNVVEDFTIRATNATDGTNVWVLASTNGPDQYKLEYSTDGTWYLVNLTATTFATDKTIGGSETVDFRITMPTSTSSHQQHSLTVTFGAVKS